MRKRSEIALVWCLLSLASGRGLAAIAFEDATERSAIRYEGLSYGAAWGDFNGDGLPDLWTGNHFGAPSLYLNLGQGRFRDIAREVVTADPKADKHGAAWADFDNDGDQDLIQTVGAVAGKGEGLKQLLVNDGGRSLRDEASRLGVDFPLGRGRTPLWLDADGDGRLDLLFMNAPRPDKRGASEIFLQSDKGFLPANGQFDLFLENRKYNKLMDLLRNLQHLRFRWPHYISANDAFAQLADLDGESRLDLLAYGWQTRVYGIGQEPFMDLTAAFGASVPLGITDAAIEDFDGDGRADLFVSHSNEWPQWGQPGKSDLWLSCSGESSQGVVALNFRAAAELGFQVQPFDTKPGRVFIGEKLSHPQALEFKLAPDDFGQPARLSPEEEKAGYLDISYDHGTQQWTVRCTKLEAGVMVHANDVIEEVQESGFKAPAAPVPYTLMIKGQTGYAARSFPDGPANSSCVSVTAGDFDNDMDLDVYVVCTGPARQEPNVLLENDGKGNFHRAEGAGGAAGGTAGRGDVVVAADYDRDGFLDLVVTNGSDLASPLMAPGPNQVFRNLGNDNHWLEFDLAGRKSNRNGIGSIVEVEAGGVVQRRGQTGGMHRSAQNHQRLHFGLGGNTRVDRVTVRWPSGAVQELKGLEVDRVVTIAELPGP